MLTSETSHRLSLCLHMFVYQFECAVSSLTENPALHWCALCLTHPPKNLPVSELTPVHKIRVSLLVWPYISVMLVFVFHCLSFDWSFVSYIIVLFLVVLNWFSWHMPAENWVRSSANHLLMFTCGWLEAFVTVFVQGNSTLVSQI